MKKDLLYKIVLIASIAVGAIDLGFLILAITQGVMLSLALATIFPFFIPIAITVGALNLALCLYAITYLFIRKH